MSIWFTIFLLAFVAVSVALVLVILVQRPQGGGLATAFGGAGGGNDTAFGGRTGDALTVATVAVFSLYLICGIGLNMTDRIARPIDPAAAAATAPPASGEGSVPLPASGAPLGTPGPSAPSPAAGVPVPAVPAPVVPSPAPPAQNPAETPAAAPANGPTAPPPAETPAAKP